MRYLFYHGTVTLEGVRNVEALVAIAFEEGLPEITLCITSEGGDVTAGVGLYNFLRMMPIKVHTHVAGVCESVAATIVLAGERRTAEPLSSFMTHAAVFSEGPHVGQRSPATDLIAQPFRDVAGWSGSEIASRFTGQGFPFSPQDAVQMGVVHSVVALSIQPVDQMVTVRIP